MKKLCYDEINNLIIKLHISQLFIGVSKQESIFHFV